MSCTAALNILIVAACRKDVTLTALCHVVHAGASGSTTSGESAVRAALKDYMERLPELFTMVDIEARVKDKSPYVVVALQEVSRSR